MLPRLIVVVVSLLLATPAITFWLWLVIQSTRGANECPEECRCEEQGLNVTCSNSSSHSIPSNIPTHAGLLVLFRYNLTYFENDSFVSKGLVDLYSLDASYCKIRKMDLRAFNGLTKLRLLSMTGNEISEIIPGTFEMFSLLVYLFLSINRIGNLENNVFNGLVNLRFLSLRRNELHYLNPKTFELLPKLHYLDLSGNPGLQIPTDRHLINSLSLKLLDISGCNVRSVSVETFANVSALEWLNLGFNYLRTVDINILISLPRLSTLYLHGNPLHCDCKLQEVWRWCQDYKIQTVDMVMAPQCVTPWEVMWVWWGVLEEGHCLKDNIHYYGDYESARTRYSFTPIEDKNKDIMAKNDKKSLRVTSTFFSKVIELIPFSASIFFCIFGVTGNVIVIIIITCNKDMRTVSNMYILNLAISDIMYLTLLFFEQTPSTWQGSEINCKFFEFSLKMSVGVTAYSVALLSIQRYRVTVNPLQFRVSSPPKWRGTGAIICGLWIVAALFNIPVVLSMFGCKSYLFLLLRNYYQHLAIFQLLVVCVIPLCVIAFSYIMTARHLVKTSCAVSEERQIPQMNTRKNTAKAVLALTVVFVISYVPYHISETCFFSIYKMENLFEDMFDKRNRIVNIGGTVLILRYFIPLNSCLNPVALFFTSLAFRRHLKRYLTCCCKTNSPPTDLELTRRN